jgi:hypothetical protein
MAKKNKVTMKDVENIAKTALENLYEDTTPEWITNVITSSLERARESIILDAIGLRKSQKGELEISYNGSYKSGALLKTFPDKIRKQALELTQEWINAGNKDDIVALFTDAQKKQLQIAFKNAYIEAVKENLIQLAYDKAQIDAEELWMSALSLNNSLTEEE